MLWFHPPLDEVSLKFTEWLQWWNAGSQMHIMSMCPFHAFCAKNNTNRHSLISIRGEKNLCVPLLPVKLWARTILTVNNNDCIMLTHQMNHLLKSHNTLMRVLSVGRPCIICTWLYRHEYVWSKAITYLNISTIWSYVWTSCGEV